MLLFKERRIRKLQLENTLNKGLFKQDRKN